MKKTKVIVKPSKHQVNVKLKEKASKFAIFTKKDDIALPAVIVFSGARGSGKTYACIMLVRHFEKKKYITRTFLLSPTRHSNDLYSNLKTLSDDDSYEDENHFSVALHHILSAIQKDWEEYDQAQEYIRVYNKAQRDPLQLTAQEQMLIEYQQGNPPTPVRKPSHMLIVDDAQGTSLYNNSRQDLLTHIVIKHRHIPVSICMLAQSWTGIPRAIRLNTTHFAVYKTGDKTQLKQIYDTFANTIEFEQFEKMYKEAVEKPYGFLFIDTVPKKEYKRFRSGYNQYLK
jgi:tRNA A37 threonylcarbamoyladenosine biosynthesis protein TsaE